MNEIYEYRVAPNPWAIRIAMIAIMMLVITVSFSDRANLRYLIWSLGAVTVVWMLLPRPISGIRIDDTFLILGAWRSPRLIRLDDIAYLIVTEVSAESRISVVYRDGRIEATFAGDMPDIDTLSEVLAVRGIPLREVY